MRATTLLGPGMHGVFPGTQAAQAAAIDALPVVRELARSRTTSADLVALPDGRRAVRKLWRWPRAADRAKGAFRTTVAARSPARREYEALLRLASISPPDGPFAPRPLAAAERRNAGVLHACALLLDEVADTVDLATFLVTERRPAARARALEDLARRTAAMHGAGLRDREFHARNVLVERRTGRTWKIDAPKQRAGRGEVAAAGAADDLGQLDVGLALLASPAEREGLFGAYRAARGAAAPSAAQIEAARKRHHPKESRRLPGHGVSSASGRADNGR
ncbi:MAG: hypothetical protein HMLKMBBP_00720 [Planctomycetes bacterium]|nr:hypothetical protein [Planctomycetota bacterium]